MSTGKATPGPWKWNDHYLGLRQVSEKGREEILAFVAYEGLHLNRDLPEGRAQANARLIAAAPELRDALRSLVVELEKFDRTAHPGGPDGARDFMLRLRDAQAVLRKLDEVRS